MMNPFKAKKGLGRGLSSLIGDTDSKPIKNKLSISSIVKNKFQPRKHFEKEAMDTAIYWNEEGFNATKGGLLVLVLMLGYVVGGQLGKRFGGKSVIIYSALGGTLITVCWGLTESLWENSIFLVSIWSVHTFIWGMASINIYSLMMKITWPEVGGTQFTAYMAMMNLSAVIGLSLIHI